MTEARPAIALLIDADNAALGSLDQVLSALAEHGDPIIRRAYGNWFKPALKAWDPEVNRRGLRPVQQSDAPAGEPKSKPEPKRQPTLPELLTGAIAKNADKQGWARVSAVANYMRQKHGQSAKDHGKATWTKVLKSLPGYEFRNEGTTSVAVRVKKSE